MVCCSLRSGRLMAKNLDHQGGESVNLPNKLTMARIVLIPFFVVVLMAPLSFPGQNWVALAIFAVACITDFFDGQIARKNNLVTNFGKFMDPLADKLLVCAALVCLSSLQVIPAWMTVVIISREFVVSGLRLIAAERGIVIAAGWSGKIKTCLQMFAIIFAIAAIEGIQLITSILLWAATIMTIVSMAEYLYKNRYLLSDK